MSSSSQSRQKEASQAPLFSIFWPVLIVLGCLIFSTARDIIVIHTQKAVLFQENQRLTDQLKAAGNQSQFIESLHKETAKIASTNPAVAKILTDFFPPPPKRSTADLPQKPAEKKPSAPEPPK